MTAANAQGVYFLANDVIAEWAIAFLESFRAFNPDLPLRLIPFDERCDRLLSLTSKYNFQPHDDPSYPALEEIGRRVNGGKTRQPNVYHAPRWFRRFASFWGPFEDFLYLDGRLLVLSDLREILAARRASGCDLLHYDCALDQVYLQGSFLTELARQRRPHGFLSGMFASRRGLLDLGEMQQFADRADAVREHLNTPNGDQCFINFVWDTKPLTYAAFSEVMPDVSSTGWSRGPSVYREGNDYRRWDHGGLEHAKRVLMMHWAGHPLSPVMPQRELFLRYRLRSEPLGTRLAWRASWYLQYPFLKVADTFRRDRRSNVFFHTLRHRLTGKALPHTLRKQAPPLPAASSPHPGE